ncbi:DUF222 domain-containing protein [Actinomadura sp. 9N407]|uniref:HNH endonuclease signature motif containing protein n=1 Tax=Actinomadura sp. 9N407 TaxID=3375154 RepID=UPI0037AED76D
MPPTGAKPIASFERARTFGHALRSCRDSRQYSLMRSSVIDVRSLTTGELVDAAASIASELARRVSPGTAADPAADQAPAFSAAACMDWAETLIRAADVQESTLAGLIGMVDRAGEMRRWGYPSTQAWLRSRLGMRDARAKDRVLLSRHLLRLPEVTRRLAHGSLSSGYALAVVQSVARLGDDDCAKAEALLLEMADDGFSAAKVAVFGTRIRDLIAERDGNEPPPDDATRGYERSWITSTRSLDGGRYLKGWLNPEDAAIFDGTLAALAKPAGPDDLRDLPERTAAALTSVLSGGHRATKITLTVGLDTLTGGRAPGRLPDGSPIPAAQARRIALAAGVSPLLLGPGSIPLYLGRRVRFATLAQRRVLEALYPTCAVRGCEVPGTLCEVDHVDGWALNDGTTDIDRLTLCCGWHNRFKHSAPQQIRIRKDEQGRFVYRLLPPPDRWTERSASRSRSRTREDDGDTPAAATPPQPAHQPKPGRTRQGNPHPSTRTCMPARQPAGP